MKRYLETIDNLHRRIKDCDDRIFGVENMTRAIAGDIQLTDGDSAIRVQYIEPEKRQYQTRSVKLTSLDADDQLAIHGILVKYLEKLRKKQEEDVTALRIAACAPTADPEEVEDDGRHS